MGFKDAAWAYTLKLPMAQKVVLVAICHAADDKTHITIVGQKTIAGMVGLSEDTVRRAVGILDDLGIISRKKRHRANGALSSPETTVNRAYPAETLEGTEPSRQTAYKADSGDLPDSVPPPTGFSAGGNGINQIDQPKDQPDTSPNGDGVDRGLQPSLELSIPAMPFEEFWKIWPRKDSKKAAQLAWVKAIKRADSNVIVEAARSYRDNPHIPARQFIPHAATWLNGDRWHDPLPEPPELRRTTRNDGDLAYLHDLQQREAQAQRGITS